MTHLRKTFFLLAAALLTGQNVLASNEPTKLKIHYNNTQTADTELSLSGFPVLTFGKDSVFVQLTPTAQAVGYRLTDNTWMELAQGDIPTYTPAADTPAGGRQTINIVIEQPEPEPIVPDVIDLASASVTVTLASQNRYYYTADSVKATVSSVTCNGVALQPGTDYIVTYANNVNAGIGTVKIWGKGQYTGSVDKPFTILQETLVVTATNKTKTYGDPLPELSYRITGFRGSDDASCLTSLPKVTTDVTDDSPVGTYRITVNGTQARNYLVSHENGTLTVTPANLTIKANNVTLEYGDELPKLTSQIAGFVGDDNVLDLTKQPVLTTTYQTLSPVGTYDITVSGAEAQNYLIAYEGATLTVKPKDITGATVTMDTVFVYTGSPIMPECTVMLGGRLLVENTDYTLQPTNNTNVGRAQLSIIGQGNYTNHIDTMFVIEAPVVDGISLAGAAATVRIYDAAGRLVWSGEAADRAAIDALLARQPKGLYIIKVNNNTFKINKK